MLWVILGLLGGSYLLWLLHYLFEQLYGEVKQTDLTDHQRKRNKKLLLVISWAIFLNLIFYNAQKGTHCKIHIAHVLWRQADPHSLKVQPHFLHQVLSIYSHSLYFLFQIPLVFWQLTEMLTFHNVFAVHLMTRA